jgi:hypothetical protein
MTSDTVSSRQLYQATDLKTSVSSIASFHHILPPSTRFWGTGIWGHWALGALGTGGIGHWGYWAQGEMMGPQYGRPVWCGNGTSRRTNPSRVRSSRVLQQHLGVYNKGPGDSIFFTRICHRPMVSTEGRSDIGLAKVQTSFYIEHLVNIFQ